MISFSDQFTSGLSVVNNFIGKKGLLLVGGAQSYQNPLDMAAGLTGSTQMKFWEIDENKIPNNYTNYLLRSW
jgi:hypothetical protein